MCYKKLKLLLLSIPIFLLVQCAVEDWVSFSKSPFDPKPNWDMDFKLPLMEKNQSLSEYIDFPDIIYAETPDIPYVGDTWPATSLLKNTSITTTENLKSAPALIDFDSDGTTDFILKKVSSDSGYMQLSVSLKENDEKTSIPLELGDISIEPLTIENTTYEFDGGIVKDGVLIFRTKDFLTANHDLEIEGNEVNFGKLNLKINPENKPARTQIITTKPIYLSFGFEFSYGENWVLTGDIQEEKNLMEYKNVSVPIKSIPVAIDPLLMKVEINNDTFMKININPYFSADNEIFNISNTNSGVITVNNNATTNLNLSVDGVILEKDDLKFNVITKIMPATSVEIRKDLSIFIKMGIEAGGKIDLEKF